MTDRLIPPRIPAISSVPPLRDYARGTVLPDLTDDALTDPRSALGPSLRARLLQLVPEQRQNVLACVHAMTTRTEWRTTSSDLQEAMLHRTGVLEEDAWRAVLAAYPHVLRLDVEEQP